MSDQITLPALLRQGGDPRGIPLDTARLFADDLPGRTVTVDCETTGYPLGHPHYALRTVQVGYRRFALVLDAADPAQRQIAVDALDGAREIVAHSATADISLLALAHGVDPAPWWDKATDTMVLAALTDQHLISEDLGLEKLSARLIKDPCKPTTATARRKLFSENGWLTETRPDTPLARSGWANVPVGDPTMVRYAAADVLDTARLREALGDPQPQVTERERRLHGILARVTERGLRLDPARVAQLVDHHTGLRDASAERLRSTWGITRPSSNASLAEALVGLGADLPRSEKTGKPSVAKDAIDTVARDAASPAGALAREILEWRKHEKLLGTYLLTLSAQCAPGGDCRSHPTIHQLGARATGRMSSSGPNIQNIPRPRADDAVPGGLRSMFVADPGHLFISADFSSVEVRLAAAVTHDATLAGMVRDGLDLHARVVEMVWGLAKPSDPSDPAYAQWKALRYGAKASVFGYLYGAGLTRMTAQLGEHGDKAAAVRDALAIITPQLVSWNEELKRQIKSRQARSWWHQSGRASYFDERRPHKGLNTVVQGWGRELLVDAILRWEDMHPGCMIVPIHDELLIQVPAEHATAWLEDLRACMTFTCGEGDATVPIVCEADAPTMRWGTHDTAWV